MKQTRSRNPRLGRTREWNIIVTGRTGELDRSTHRAAAGVINEADAEQEFSPWQNQRVEYYSYWQNWRTR